MYPPPSPPPSRQVRTSSCRARLDRYTRELDHFLQALTPQPHHQHPGGGTPTGNVCDNGGEQGLTGGQQTLGLGLRGVSGWGQEERVAMGRFCEEVCMGCIGLWIGDLFEAQGARSVVFCCTRGADICFKKWFNILKNASRLSYVRPACRKKVLPGGRAVVDTLCNPPSPPEATVVCTIEHYFSQSVHNVFWFSCLVARLRGIYLFFI